MRVLGKGKKQEMKINLLGSFYPLAITADVVTWVLKHKCGVIR
jgi:hypothetical protein